MLLNVSLIFQLFESTFINGHMCLLFWRFIVCRISSKSVSFALGCIGYYFSNFVHAGSAMAELGRLLIYEASRDWLVSISDMHVLSVSCSENAVKLYDLIDYTVLRFSRQSPPSWESCLYQFKWFA